LIELKVFPITSVTYLTAIKVWIPLIAPWIIKLIPPVNQAATDDAAIKAVVVATFLATLDKFYSDIAPLAQLTIGIITLIAYGLSFSNSSD